MIETLAALILGHVLADFVFQTGWMVREKRRPEVLLLHAAVVLVMAQAAVGQVAAAALLALAAAHLGIDAAKTWLAPPGLAAFLGDQAAHLAVIVAVAIWAPGLWAGGIWAGQPALPGLMLLAAGLITATLAGGHAVGMLMKPWAGAAPEGLPNGGRIIGLLERALIFLLVLAGETQGIGFLIAAKSLLRFGAVKDEGRLSEYVIVGTLASFGWAIAVATGVIWLMARLPPLGIPDISP